MPTPSSNPSWLYSTPQASRLNMSQTVSDRLYERLAGSHSRLRSEEDVPNSVQTPSDAEWSQATFTYDTALGANVSSLNETSSIQSNNWPLTEKRYPLAVETHGVRCPKPTIWKTILLPAVIVIIPMALLVAGLLGLIFGYRVKSDESLFEEVSNADAMRNHAVVLVNYSATRIVFVASWASTLAPLLAGFVMNLSSFRSALMMVHSSSGVDQCDLPTPYQYCLLVGLCLASMGRLRRYYAYSIKDAVVIPPVLRRAAQTLTLTLLLALIVFAADTALHYTTSTINFDQVSVSTEMHTYGRGLSEQCLTLDRAANFGLPCSRNDVVAQADYEAYVAGQNEIFFLQHGTSNTSRVTLVPTPKNQSSIPDGKVALLLPQTVGLSPFRDFRATTTGVMTTCTPISSECKWKTLGLDELYSQFNCSQNFWGVLGKAANLVDTGSVINDSDVSPLAFKPGAALQYAFFTDKELNTPYDSTGVNRPFLTDAQLINPVYLGVAARFALTAQRAGINMSADPGVHQGPTTNIDFILRCQYTTYLADYEWVNSTAQINSLTPSPNGTLAEIFHGYNLAGSYSAFDSNLQDYIAQAALQSDAQAMADSFADSYSARVMSVIGAFLSSRTNSHEQTRTPLLVAKVPKAPLAILAACCLSYVVFGVVSAVLAYRALNQVDVRDLALRFSLPALGLHAFRDATTDEAAVTIDAAGHRVFDETKIRSETMRVAVEGEPTTGFPFKSLV